MVALLDRLRNFSRNLLNLAPSYSSCAVGRVVLIFHLSLKYMHSSLVPIAKDLNIPIPFHLKPVFKVLCKHSYVLMNFANTFSFATMPTLQTMV